MSFDASKLRGFSEKDLSKALYRIAISMGASEMRARAAADKAPQIKQILERSSDAELERIVNSIGREKAEKIIKDIDP